MAGGLGLLCLVPATAPVWLLAVLMMPVAFGAALAVSAMTTMLLSGVAPELAGTASGVLNASRQLGGALTIAVLGALTAAFGNFLTG